MSTLRRGQLHPRGRSLRRDAEQGVALLQLRIDIVEPSRTRRGFVEESPTLGKERQEGFDMNRIRTITEREPIIPTLTALVGGIIVGILVGSTEV